MTALVLQNSISQSSSHTKKYNTLITQYGDNYIQRASDGINTQIEVWNLLFDNLDETEVGILQNFLDTVGMFGVIEWAPKGEDYLGSPIPIKKWIVDPDNEISVVTKAGNISETSRQNNTPAN